MEGLHINKDALARIADKMKSGNDTVELKFTKHEVFLIWIALMTSVNCGEYSDYEEKEINEIKKYLETTTDIDFNFNLMTRDMLDYLK